MEIIVNSSDEEDSSENTSPASIPHSVLSLSVFLLSWQASFKVSDTCVNALLTFLFHFLSFIGTLSFSSQLSEFAQKLPKNIKHLRKVTGINVDTFTSFVVCPQCHSLYDFDQCLTTVGNRKDVKRCQHISYLFVGLNKLIEKLDSRHKKHMQKKKTPSFQPYPRVICSPSKAKPKKNASSWAIAEHVVLEPLTSTTYIRSRSHFHVMPYSKFTQLQQGTNC